MARREHVSYFEYSESLPFICHNLLYASDVLKFDNSHSFIRSKKVIYYVYVQEPEQTDS